MTTATRHYVIVRTDLTYWTSDTTTAKQERQIAATAKRIYNAAIAAGVPAVLVGRDNSVSHNSNGFRGEAVDWWDTYCRRGWRWNGPTWECWFREFA